MPGHRMERITEDVHRELTAIFRELKDPRAQQGMLSIVRVEVTNDLSHCNVYVSSMLGMEKCKEACVGLKVRSRLYAWRVGASAEAPSCAAASFHPIGFH